jgi:hypothetical protein
MGIEPTFVAWEATVLPLNYTRTWPRVARQSGFYRCLPGQAMPGGVNGDLTPRASGVESTYALDSPPPPVGRGA